MSSIQINNSYIIYNENTCKTFKDYYDYISLLLYKILENNPQFNVVLVFENVILDNSIEKDIIYIFLNIEHTLVRIGGRDTENSSIGVIPVVGVGEEKGENYLVRIDKYELLQQKHIVIDYSNPNIINVRESGLFNNFSEKMLYISPILYPFCVSSQNRDISCLTTFININEPRRRKLLENSGITNINNCFERIALQKLYMRTQIMINIHQTDHHHTFEELRVLPALCCGVIVICESSSLLESIPYNKFVIWTDYDNILEKRKEVMDNYAKYYHSIFGENTLRDLLLKMENDNYNNLYNKIREIAT